MMLFIVPLIAFFIVGIMILLAVSGGMFVMSGDKISRQLPSSPVVPSKPKAATKPVAPPKPKAYIDLNGRLIELMTKAEETKAKKDGFKVVYK